MPLTPRSEPRRKGSPRWFLVFWLVVIGFRVWQQNHAIGLVIFAVALLILLSGLRRTEGAGASGPISLPTSTSAPPRSIETITMPAAPPDARPIEPDVGGATGKLLVFAIVLVALAILAALVFHWQGWKLTP